MRNFKCIILFMFFSFIIQFTFAQKDEAYEKLKTKMWGDPDFKTTEIPEKWKNESAVILAKSYEYSIQKEVLISFVYENTFLHKRVKLMDKSAVNQFSELSFENDHQMLSFWSTSDLTDVKIGIKVIKPSGKENIIDLKEAVQKEIKEGMNKKEYKKIAVPDLEIGDIIDYFYVIKNTDVVRDLKFMDPVFYLLVEQYPILKQKFNVHILRKFYFNSKSINGAPELKQNDVKDETSYSFVDNNREKADANLWSHPFRIYPTLKFQAIFVTKMGMFSFLDFFLKDKKTNNSVVDFANIDKLARNIYNSNVWSDYYLPAEVKEYLNKNFDKNSPPDTIIKYSYYYLRKKTREFGPNSLMLTLSKVLAGRKIQHDLVITVPNAISDISDLIIPKELAFLIRIKGKPDYIIGDFSPISNFKNISSEYQGNNAYAINNPDLVSKPKVEKIVIPVDKPELNQQATILNVKFDKNKMDSLVVNIDKTIKGIGREDEIAYLVTDIAYQDEVSSGLNKIKEKSKKKSAKELKAEKEKLEKLEQEQKDCQKGLKMNYKNEYKAGDDFKIDSYSLKQMGIWDNSPELKYNVSFKLGNLVKKMGPNYMIAIGKLITGQLELSKKDLDRKVDIYAPYPRIYEYKINFEIPSGYKVKGLEKLNVDISNLTGGFNGKAEIQNSNLVVNVKKYYNHNIEKVAEWPKMVEFIDAAFNFTQQNILLVKQ